MCKSVLKDAPELLVNPILTMAVGSVCTCPPPLPAPKEQSPWLWGSSQDLLVAWWHRLSYKPPLFSCC